MKLHCARIEGTECADPPLLKQGTRGGRKLLRFVLVLLTCCAAALGTQAEPAPANPNRFLFIIDTSASMKPFDKALQETIFDLVYSGLRGCMTNGDTYGIWLINEQNDTSFSVESWKQRYNVQLAAKALAHVKDHGYKGGARLDVAMAEALRIVKNVGDLTIVLVSNGETPIAGTPFDEAINGRFRQLAPEMKRAKATLNTVFVARDGELVAWSANSAEFLINVPFVPPKPKPTTPQNLASKSNVSSARMSNSVARSITSAATAAPTIAAPPKPRAAAPPIIITKETVAQERRAFQAMTMIGATNDTLAPASTNLHAAATTAGQTNVTTGNSAADGVKEIIVAANISSGQSNKTSLAAATNRVETIAAAPTETKIPEPAITAPAAPALTVNSAPSEPMRSSASFHPVLWAGIGAGITLVCVLLLAMVCRGRRIQPSLISQAAAREPLRAS